jgi:methionyl-tRNA synthetase
MTTKKTFYVTTAIDYPNAEPHIGHAYQKIIADVLSRWHRLLGEDVFFLTGTDEHGKKIQESAEKAGKTPKQFVDEMAAKFKEAWKCLNIKYDRFIRTTDSDHEALVQEVIKKCDKTGDIYKGQYEGLYCVGCEAYYTEKECPDKICQIHKKPLETIKEESYFFKLSKYEKYLLDLYKKQPNFVLPETRRNEIISRVSEGLKDLSISRTSFDWGIPFPLDKKHIVYVWMDALFNYISGAGKNSEYWPASIHLLGKDNGWFHAVYWPAFLKSAGYKLPKTVFIHGFLTFNGQKVSKSLGNAISPIVLAEKYSADSIRYFVTRNFVFGEDGDFSEQALIERHNNELANKLGNLVSRVSTLAETYGLKRKDKELAVVFEPKKIFKQVSKLLEKYAFDKSLNIIFAYIDSINEYLQSKKPWETHDSEVIYEAANAIKNATILISPFIPETCEKIAKTFNFDISLDALNKPLNISKIIKSPILFKKINVRDNNTINNKLNKEEGIEGIMTTIDFKDWEKLDLRVGKIEKVEDMEGADKLYKLTVNIGSESKVVVAGIKQFYKKEDLQDKRCVLFVNLTPRKMRGLVSEGMILAAVNDDESQVVLLQPEKDIAVGSKVR